MKIGIVINGDKKIRSNLLDIIVEIRKSKI